MPAAFQACARFAVREKPQGRPCASPVSRQPPPERPSARILLNIRQQKAIEGNAFHQIWGHLPERQMAFFGAFPGAPQAALLLTGSLPQRTASAS